MKQEDNERWNSSKEYHSDCLMKARVNHMICIFHLIDLNDYLIT